MSQFSSYDALYNLTFTLYRLSPLYHPVAPPLFAQDTLLAHSHRLKDALKGDVLRGVSVSLDDQASSTPLGPLKRCHWILLQSGITTEIDARGIAGLEGIYIELEYTTKTYTAFLLRSVTAGRAKIPGETRLPLLLTCMPAAVRDVLHDYLTTTFDTRIERMRLSNRFLDDILEKCLDAAQPQYADHFEKQIKGIQLVMSFKAPIAPGLKNLAIDLRREDVLKFLNRGKAIIRGGDISNDSEESGPFMSSVRGYIQDQTALNISHTLVSISTLTCGAFVLAADGNVKIAPPMAPTNAEDETVAVIPNRSLSTLLLEQLIANSEKRLY